MRAKYSPDELVPLATVAGATTPNLGAKAGWVWSSTSGMPLFWSGSKYSAPLVAGLDAPFANHKATGLKVVSFFAEFDCENSGAAKTVDFANGQKQRITLNNAAPVLTIAAPAEVGHYQLRIIQDGAGGRVPTIAGLDPGRWLRSATAPPVNAVPSGETILSMYWDGTHFSQSASNVGAV